MIYEIRTYTLVPGTVAKFEERFAEGYAYRSGFSPLTAFWHSEGGQEHQVVHIWPYKDLTERTAIRAQAADGVRWPPKTGDFVLDMRVDILNPFPDLVSPSGRAGAIVEIQYDYYRVCDLGAARQQLRLCINERSKSSVLVLAGSVEIGRASALVHIWAYTDMAHRDQLVNESEARRHELGSGTVVPRAKETRIVSPAQFSPLQ